MNTHFSYDATVLRVVDGDTVDLVIDLGFDISQKMRCRLWGINAPEMNTKAGVAARAALLGKVQAGPVRVDSHKDRSDKYGRYLAELFVGDENLNQWMVDNGHAVEYMR